MTKTTLNMITLCNAMLAALNFLKFKLRVWRLWSVHGLLLALMTLYSSSSVFAQNMGINSTGARPDSSAMLDVSSTTKDS
ncbi:MAG: hypothetical protein R2813_10320 [Flavobacteriales bacterium]